MKDMIDKTIAIFSPSLSGGGAERAAGKLAKSLEPCVKKIYFFCLYPEKKNYEYGGELVDFGFDKIRNKYLKFGHLIFHARIFIEYLKLPYTLRSRKKELGIDYTISFLDLPGVFNILSRVQDKVIVSVRISHTYEDTFYQELRKKGLKDTILNYLIKKLYKTADYVVTVSEGIRQEMIRDVDIEECRISTISNDVDIQYISEMSKEELFGKEKWFFDTHKVIINVGRLTKQKNQERLLRIFKIMQEVDSSLGLAIIGSGEREEKLKEFCRTYYLNEKVIFIPYNKNPYKYIRNANMFLLTSEKEGYPNVIVEAMACRIPVASFDCKTGPREILSDNITIKNREKEAIRCERGLLLSMKISDKDAAKELIYFLKDEKYKACCVEEGIKYLKQKCTKDVTTEKWKMIIRK